jgi:hypothetical protein
MAHSTSKAVVMYDVYKCVEALNAWLGSLVTGSENNEEKKPER